MEKRKEVIKWVVVGILVALSISGVMYLTFPKVEVLGSSKESVEGSDYSATIYGAPDIDLEHYRLSEDKYFNYLIKGDLDVGRLDPATYSRWYKGLVEEAFREYVLYKESGMEEGSIYDASEDSIGAFVSWYKGEYANKDEVKGLTEREIEEVIFNIKEIEAEREGTESVEGDEDEGLEEDGEEEDGVDGEEGIGEVEEGEVDASEEDSIERINEEDNEEADESLEDKEEESVDAEEDNE